MRRSIVTALIIGPLAVLAIDRLSTPHGGLADPAVGRAFDFHRRGPGHQPPVPPPPHRELTAYAPDPAETVVVASELKANEARALDDLRGQVDRRVADWLVEAGIPDHWHPPARMVDALTVEAPEVGVALRREYGDLYRAEVPLALTASNRSLMIETYRRQVAVRRRAVLGVGLGFTLACLAILAGYIRGDEATRGYYTTRLRLIAGVALGGAALAAYRALS